MIDIASGEPVTVAIFSTAGFDATRIIPGSLRLAGASQRGIADNPGGVRADVVDLNGDGRPDLKARFRVDRLQFSPIDVVADVWGETLGGLQFSGSDLVQVVR